MRIFHWILVKRVVEYITILWLGYGLGIFISYRSYLSVLIFLLLLLFFLILAILLYVLSPQ